MVVAYVAVALAAVLHLYAAGGMAWAIYYNVFVFYWVCALLSGLFQVACCVGVCLSVCLSVWCDCYQRFFLCLVSFLPTWRARTFPCTHE